MKIREYEGRQTNFHFYFIKRDKKGERKRRGKRGRREHKRTFDSPRKNGELAMIRFDNKNRVLNAIRDYRKNLALWTKYAQTADNRGQRIHAWNEVERIQFQLDELVEFTAP